MSDTSKFTVVPQNIERNSNNGSKDQDMIQW